jgi:hypothetical protein
MGRTVLPHYQIGAPEKSPNACCVRGKRRSGVMAQGRSGGRSVLPAAMLPIAGSGLPTPLSSSRAPDSLVRDIVSTSAAKQSPAAAFRMTARVDCAGSISR